MHGRIDFSRFTLGIPDHFTMKLIKSSAGHVLLPGVIDQAGLRRSRATHTQVFPAQQTGREGENLNGEEILKIRRQLGH